MAKKNGIGTRMKQYEAATRSVLLPKTPVVVRVDADDVVTEFQQKGWA